MLAVPQVVVAQANKTISTQLNPAGNLVLPDFVVTVKSLNLPPSKIQRDGSHSLEQHSFTYIHQALGAREGIMINFKIPFSQNSITPTANGRAVIAQIARAMKFLNANVGYEIQGHSATLIKEQNNYDIALKRANQIIYILQNSEDITNPLRAISYGNKKPLTTNTTTQDKEANSRITIVNLGAVAN